MTVRGVWTNCEYYVPPDVYALNASYNFFVCVLSTTQQGKKMEVCNLLPNMTRPC